MYFGSIVEHGNVARIFKHPGHPYTKGLLESVPQIDQDPTKQLSMIAGHPPDPYQPLSGCAFARRCPYVMDICQLKKPPLAYYNQQTQQQRACFLTNQL